MCRGGGGDSDGLFKGGEEAQKFPQILRAYTLTEYHQSMTNVVQIGYFHLHSMFSEVQMLKIFSQSFH